MSYLETIQQLESQHLSFKLGDEQLAALEEIFHFIHKKEWSDFVLSGAGGSGKSSIVKLVICYLEQINIPYLLATPTNKACNVLSQLTERDTITLHKLLELKPTLNILNLDFKDLHWGSDSISSGIPYNGVLIVDECSMINEVLYNFIVDRAKNHNCKILWLGDSKQLYAVKERKLSKPFSAQLGFFLTKVWRQDKDNPVFQTISILRERPLYKFTDLRSSNGNLFTYTNWRSFIKNNIELFKEAVDNKDPLRIKLLAYTNKRVEAFNKVIRDSIFEEQTEYHIGEFLMGYDTCTYKQDKSRYSFGFDIINSSDYIVTEIFPENRTIGFHTFKGYVLTLQPLNDEYESGNVFILSRDNSEKSFEDLAAYIELLRLNAVQCKDKRKGGKLWRDYFEIMDSFLTPIDLSYDGRIVRKKSLDYGYCISTHKSW